MATGAPLPVREYASAEENRRHAREVHARIWGARPYRRPEPPVETKPAAIAAEITTRELIEPGHAKPVDTLVESTLAEFGRAEIVSTAQRDSGGALSGADCVHIVEGATGLKRQNIAGSSRVLPLVKARQILFWLLVTRGNKSMPHAGQFAGKRDHTTVLSGLRRVEKVIADLDLAIPADHAEAVALLWSAQWPNNLHLCVRFKPKAPPCA